MSKEHRKEKRNELKNYVKQHKVVSTVYLILRLIVIVIMIPEIFNRNYNNVFLCVLTLVLFMIPSFVERKIKIDVPDLLEIIIILFIFAAEILGELREYYLTFPYWDTMLHTTNGFLCAAIGFALIDILNGSERVSFNVSPIFAAVCAFCFSMTIGVLWEFFEYFMDVVFHTDMQKDEIINTVSSVLFNPEGRNIATTITVDSITLNGMTFDGYIDIGLRDTMMDMFVNFIGAVVFSIIGFFYVRKRGKSKFVEGLIPRKKNDNGQDKTKTE
ncbi:MAG: hypothetical protein PUB32_05180 [Clostridiales bacterium]|nr:hypothetical protein [Clostridiales bacterium]